MLAHVLTMYLCKRPLRSVEARDHEEQTVCGAPSKFSRIYLGIERIQAVGSFGQATQSRTWYPSQYDMPRLPLGMDKAAIPDPNSASANGVSNGVLAQIVHSQAFVLARLCS